MVYGNENFIELILNLSFDVSTRENELKSIVSGTVYSYITI